jgi:hypothetical protein
MAQFDVKQQDIMQTNVAVRQLIEATENPRHRYLLQAFDRHRNLEHAGRFEEIFTPEMTVEHPVYRFNMLGQSPIELDPEDVLTTEGAAELLEPLIKPLAPFDDSLLPTTNGFEA